MHWLTKYVTLPLVVGTVAMAIVGSAVKKPTPPAVAPAPADQTPEEREQESAKGARYVCLKAIEAVANDPSSVEQVEKSKWPAVRKDDTWTVRATIRAKNGFGALTLAEFECKVKDEGTQWRALSAVQLP